MNKLLSTELKRAMKSPILWIGMNIIIVLDIYGILLNSYGFNVYITTFIFENAARICIILAILIPLHIGQDFEVRTVNNKITAGYTRKQIYLAEIFVSTICSMILYIIDIVSVFVCSTIAGLKFSDGISYSAFLFNEVIGLVCIITISALFTLIVMLARKQLISIGITVILTLSLLTVGGNTVSNLGQPEYIIDTQSNEMVENVLYNSGFKRTLANAHLLISPFAQIEYEETMLFEPESKAEYSLILKSFPYHIEFIIFNLLELLLFCKVGTHIFKRQDLK